MNSFSRAQMIEEMKGKVPFRIWGENPEGKRITSSELSKDEAKIIKKINEFFDVLETPSMPPGLYQLCYTNTSKNGFVLKLPTVKQSKNGDQNLPFLSEAEITKKIEAKLKAERMEEDNKLLLSKVEALEKENAVLKEKILELEEGEEQGLGEVPPVAVPNPLLDTLFKNLGEGIPILVAAVQENAEAKRKHELEKLKLISNPNPVPDVNASIQQLAQNQVYLDKQIKKILSFIEEDPQQNTEANGSEAKS